MSASGPNNVGRAVQTDPTLTGFKLCAATRNNMQQYATGCANGRNM